MPPEFEYRIPVDLLTAHFSAIAALIAHLNAQPGPLDPALLPIAESLQRSHDALQPHLVARPSGFLK